MLNHYFWWLNPYFDWLNHVKSLFLMVKLNPCKEPQGFSRATHQRLARLQLPGLFLCGNPACKLPRLPRLRWLKCTCNQMPKITDIDRYRYRYRLGTERGRERERLHTQSYIYNYIYIYIQYVQHMYMHVISIFYIDILYIHNICIYICLAWKHYRFATCAYR